MSAREYIAKGDVLRDQGRYKEALVEYERALSENPRAITAYIGRAVCQSHLNQDKEALATIEQGLTHNPDSSYAHRIRGWVLYRMNNIPSARAAIARSLELNPYDPYCFYMMGHIDEASGSRKRALEHVHRGLELDPTNQSLLVYRAHLLKLTGRKNESLEASLQALQNNPDDEDAHASLGYAKLSQGDYKAALQSFQTALSIDPNSEMAREGLLEALRSRFVFYRLLYRYHEGMSRLGVSRGAISIGSFIAFRILLRMSRPETGLPIWARIAIGALVLIMALMWLSQPIMNVFLVFHPIGRMVLSPIMRLVTIWILILLGLCALTGLAVWLWRPGAVWGLMGGGIGLLILAIIASRPEELRSKGAVWLVHIVGALCGGISLLGILTGTNT